MEPGGAGSAQRSLGQISLVRAERRGRITPAAIRRFLGLLETLPIAIDQPRIACAWHDSLPLAQRHRLTSHDDADLELALRLGLPLASRAGLPPPPGPVDRPR